MKSLFSSLLVVAFLCVTVAGCGPAATPESDGGAAPAATEAAGGDEAAAPAAGEGEAKTEESGSDAKE